MRRFLLVLAATVAVAGGGVHANAVPPAQVGELGGLVTIVGGPQSVTQHVWAPNFACGGGPSGDLYLVSCVPTVDVHVSASETICDEVEVTAEAEGSGSLDATSQCQGGPSAHVHVNAPSSGDASAQGNGRMPWQCIIVVSGSPAPWQVTCTLWYHE